MVRVRWAMVVVMVACTVLMAADNIRVENQTAGVGATGVEVRILADCDQAVTAFSVAGQYPAGLTLQSIDLGGAVASADWDNIQIVGAQRYFKAAVIIEYRTTSGPGWNALPAGSDHHILSLHFNVDGGVAAGTVLTIDLRQDLGSPPVQAVFSTDTASSVYPSITDGTLTIMPGPSISTITPDSGTTAGGTAVTIAGSDFTASTVLTIGGITVGSASVENTTTITATTLADAAGAVDVEVSNEYGSDVLGGGFTYVAPPTVASIAPTSGPVAGGTPVTITGTGFISGSTTVTIGGDPLQGTTVGGGGTTITGTTPDHAAGTVDVVVTTTPYGSATLGGAFSYETPPTISSITPQSGPTTGNTPVTIAGTNFVSVTAVTVGGKSLNGLSVNGTTEITGTTQDHAAGAVDVVVTTSYGSATLSSGFLYVESPTISSIAPTTGSTAEGTFVTITGANLSATTTVTVGGVALSNKTFVNATEITGDTPAHSAGAVDVTVSNTYGDATLSGGFTYVTPPVITSISPDKGLTTGGTLVTVLGTDFDSSTAVTLNGSALQGPLVVNSTTITGTTPAHTAGAVDVTVTNDYGTDILVGGFTYEFVPSPNITSVVPNSGDGDAAITINGQNFVPGDTAVTIGGASVTPGPVTATTIACQVPACTVGGWLAITVTTSSGSDTLLEGYLCSNTFRRGDANCDSEVNIADPIYILDYLFSGGPSLCFEAMDVNDDATVNISDPVYDLMWLFRDGSPPPPVPFPDLGRDPGGVLGCATQCGLP